MKAVPHTYGMRTVWRTYHTWLQPAYTSIPVRVCKRESLQVARSLAMAGWPAM